MNIFAGSQTKEEIDVEKLTGTSDMKKVKDNERQSTSSCLKLLECGSDA